MVARAHPRDSTGLVLPDGSWPDARGVAGPLERVRRFCNTVNRENGADAWRSASELDTWLARRGVPGPAEPRRRPAPGEGRARGDLGQRPLGHPRPIAEAVPGVRVGCEATGGAIRLVAAGDTFEAVVTELVLEICDADRAGTFVV